LQRTTPTMAAGRLTSNVALAAALSLAAPATGLFVRNGEAITRSQHPVEGVLDLLQRLSTTVDEEGKAEALTFVKFQHWCGRSTKSLSEAIASAKASLEEIREGISSNTQTIDGLTDEISIVIDELAQHQAAGYAAVTQRTAGSTLATAELTALTNTITAIRDALKEMTDSHTLTEPGLLQSRIDSVLALADARLSGEELSFLETFNSSGNATRNATVRPNLTAAGDAADHVDVYDFKSHKVVELLKSLQSKFEEEFTQRTKEETAAVNAYDLAKAANDDLITAAGNAKTAKETSRGTANTTLQFLLGEETNTENDIGADTSTLSTTEHTCGQRATEWAERSKVRSNEIDAIEAAVEILSKATGVRTAQPTNPTMPPSPVLLQLAAQPEVKNALRLLREEARLTKSAAIAQLAQAVAAHADGPFDAVVNSIEKMIFRLLNEQTEEDNHKHWCDKELEKTAVNIQDKVDKIAELDGKIGVANGRAGQLQTEATAAHGMVGQIVAHVQDATELRKENKQQNKLAIEDAEQATKALTQALAVIKDFYKESGKMTKEAWELLQVPVALPTEPALWSSPYTGVADPTAQPGGIVSVLETVSSQFALMESDTLAAEEADQTAYAEDVKNCQIEKARRTKEAEVKDQERKRLLDQVTSITTARKGVQKEKEAGDQYKIDLQPACVDGGSNYTDRKAARAEEVTALRSAQDHLQDAFENVTRS